ncbi:hypothetical protein TeGR_g13614, partial [Tetraparma gracilis]
MRLLLPLLSALSLLLCPCASSPLRPSSSVLPPPPAAKPASALDVSRGGNDGGASQEAGASLLAMALAGSLATMIGDLSMHPIDCIKTLQQ